MDHWSRITHLPHSASDSHHSSPVPHPFPCSPPLTSSNSNSAPVRQEASRHQATMPSAERQPSFLSVTHKLEPAVFSLLQLDLSETVVITGRLGSWRNFLHLPRPRVRACLFLPSYLNFKRSPATNYSLCKVTQSLPSIPYYCTSGPQTRALAQTPTHPARGWQQCSEHNLSSPHPYTPFPSLTRVRKPGLWLAPEHTAHGCQQCNRDTASTSALPPHTAPAIAHNPKTNTQSRCVPDKLANSCDTICIVQYDFFHACLLSVPQPAAAAQRHLVAYTLAPSLPLSVAFRV